MVLSGCDVQTLFGNFETADGVDSGESQTELAVLPPPSAAAVRKAQRQLATLGYNPGPTDGVLGKKTRIAIKHFQVDEELDVDGELTPEVIASLGKAHRRHPAGQTRIYRETNSISGGNTLEAPGPFYEVGDTYVYSDGRVETVSRVGPERTLWETAEGSVYTAYRNFILPPISWESGSSRIENQIRPAAGDKWPLATAKEVVFSVGSKAGGEAVDAAPVWSGRWRCVSGGVTRAEVTFGRFDAVVIECDRAKPEPGTWKKRIWYFVPEVGHYVRRIDLFHGTGREVAVDLVAVRPGGKGWPQAARGGLDWAVQGALEADSIEKTVEWRSSAVGAMFSIRLKGRISVSGKADCRRYDIERISPDQVRRFPAIACKMPWQERWLTPGLDPDAISPRLLTLP